MEQNIELYEFMIEYNQTLLSIEEQLCFNEHSPIAITEASISDIFKTVKKWLSIALYKISEFLTKCNYTLLNYSRKLMEKYEKHLIKTNIKRLRRFQNKLPKVPCDIEFNGKNYIDLAIDRTKECNKFVETGANWVDDGVNNLLLSLTYPADKVKQLANNAENLFANEERFSMNMAKAQSDFYEVAARIFMNNPDHEITAQNAITAYECIDDCKEAIDESSNHNKELSDRLKSIGKKVEKARDFDSGNDVLVVQETLKHYNRLVSAVKTGVNNLSKACSENQKMISEIQTKVLKNCYNYAMIYLTDSKVRRSPYMQMIL